MSKSKEASEAQWTVRVQGAAAREDAPSLVVHGQDLMPLVARLLADARVDNVVVRPRAREVRAEVRARPAGRGNAER